MARRFGMTGTVVGFMVGFAAGLTFCGPSPGRAQRPAEPPPASAAQPASSPLTPPEERIPLGLGAEERRDVEVFRRASGSVVNVTSIALQENFFDMTEIPQGAGTGFVWDRKGHIVTNFHVIAQGDKFSVTLSDQSTWDAEVVGAAPDKDLAVLRISAPEARLTPIEIGRSGDLAVGQKVLALGNPFGLDHSASAGIVSALGRPLRSPSGRIIRDVIQTDAAINPGNSGGPLLDSSGRLVGVNAAIFSPSGTFSGIGFAIPVDTVKRLVPQLIERGRIVRPGIGVTLLPDGQAQRWRLEGVVVVEVAPGSPAARAGIEGMRRTRRGYVIGDAIVAVEGTPISSADDLAYAFETAGVGKTVRITLLREGRRRETALRLEDVQP